MPDPFGQTGSKSVRKENDDEKDTDKEEMNARTLPTYSDTMEDFDTIEEFANFRAVATTGIRKNTLYRTASPVDPRCNRNTYADA